MKKNNLKIVKIDKNKKLFNYEKKILIKDLTLDLQLGYYDFKKGKKQNKKIKLGICGEHGGDPKSIYFCSKIGLDYVSCSPYRVPVARLSAAQAELKKNYISSFKSTAGAL